VPLSLLETSKIIPQKKKKKKKKKKTAHLDTHANARTQTQRHLAFLLIGGARRTKERRALFSKFVRGS